MWEEERKEWTIPSFILTDKRSDISFPAINAKARVEQMRDDRSVKFDRDDSNSGDKGNFQNST